MTARITEREAHALGIAGSKTPHKYHAAPIVVDGERFDSTAEANHWCVLKRRLEAGEIEGLIRQPRFDLIVEGVKIGVYVADFMHTECATRAVVVSDVKGMVTPTYRMKRALMLALYRIKVLEVRA